MSTSEGQRDIDKRISSLSHSNFPLEPFLFYLRDYELHFTYLSGPRYNEYAIFIEFQEWQSYGELTFYQYLIILKTYRTLLEEVNQHPVLIIMPTGYISSHKWYHHYFDYWTTYEPQIFHFVTKIIPDVHICPLDQSNSHHLLLTPLRFDTSCLINTKNASRCKLLCDYSQFAPVDKFTSASDTESITDDAVDI